MVRLGRDLTRELPPAAPTVVAATKQKEDDQDDDQQCGRVHGCLLLCLSKLACTSERGEVAEQLRRARMISLPGFASRN